MVRQAARLDAEQQTDAQQRVDELDGFLIDFDDQPGVRGSMTTPLPAVIDGYDAALFDLDGVVYLGPVAVPGAAEGIAACGSGAPGSASSPTTPPVLRPRSPPTWSSWASRDRGR